LKEYCIYVRQGSGTPYILHTYPDIFSAKRCIQRLVDLEEERNRMYFVDNDYFYNKYFHAGNLKYMCIQEREVTEWEKYSELNNIIKNKNNIVYLKNYLKNT
jgi:hypothetical protein